MNWIYFNSALLILTTLLVQQIESSGIFEFRIKNFINDNGKDNKGGCCSGRPDSNGKCSETCKTQFRVCLKHYQAKIDTTSPCTFGDVVTPVLGENTMNLTSEFEAVPLRFQFDFAWPRTFTLIVEAWHVINGSSNGLISRQSIQNSIDISSDWKEEEHPSTYSKIKFDYRVTCDSHYYGPGCANLCRPRDDQFGHYTCSSNGSIICLAGWQDTYCLKPRCSAGCDEQHGHCNKPNECICKSGYKGALCDECESYPGCVHGTCQKPWDCHCNEGWGGLFCNQDLNYCTNHRPCQNNGTCFNTGQGSYTCQCSPGFTGVDCEVQISDCGTSPCLNQGVCHEDSLNNKYRCECRKGWIGLHCEKETQTCSERPCIHGKCRDTNTGFKCECPLGFSGATCDIQSDGCSPNFCLNDGKCINDNISYKCECKSGYTGSRCEENIDDCQGNPCQNGGECIDMLNQFRCRCIAGFIGSLCDSKVELCKTKPCANGGECINLNNDYKCSCRPGFTGKDCSIDIDECASAPCKNGGTCVNRVNNYQCVCPGGFRGDQCDEDATSSPAWESGSLSRHISSGHQESQSGRSDGLSSAQVVLIAILSVAMPVVAVIAAGVVICMKRRRKLAQEKDDAEARKQNEQNASHNLSHHQHHHHHNSMTSSKRSSSSGLDNSHNMIKNTWDKSVNNMSSSISVDECLMNTSIYGAMSNYSDNTTNDCLSTIPPLQRARSQKQLNTDPIVMHRASQLIPPKEYLSDKRISLLSDGSLCNPPRWVAPPATRQMGPCSPPHM